MKRPWCIAGCALVTCCTYGLSARAETVDFETATVPTLWGQAHGNSPGEVVLTEDAIDMSVEEFFLGPFVGFNLAEVGNVYAPFFPTTHLALDNISVRFDFANLGFVVTDVTLEYQELGGSDNFAVNGGTIFELAAMTNLPVNVAPGVIAFVGGNVITLTGDIDNFLIGGQELGIDNITAIPEPTTVALLGLGGSLLLGRRIRRKRTC